MLVNKCPDSMLVNKCPESIQLKIDNMYIYIIGASLTITSHEYTYLPFIETIVVETLAKVLE